MLELCIAGGPSITSQADANPSRLGDGFLPPGMLGFLLGLAWANGETREPCKCAREIRIRNWMLKLCMEGDPIFTIGHAKQMQIVCA